jgi:hypothetical protein
MSSAESHVILYSFQLAENDQALRQIRVVRSKKTAALSAMKKPAARKQMDETQMKEVFRNHL